MRRRTIASALCAGLMAFCAPASAEVESCTASEYAAAVDRSGAELSRASRAMQPKIQERMRAFQKAKGLTDTDYESAALEAIQDKKLEDLDAQSSELLLKIDSMGRLPEGKAPSCAELADIDRMGKELLTVVSAKSEYILVRLDAEIAKAGGQVAKEAKPAPAMEPAKDAKEAKDAKDAKEPKETKEAKAKEPEPPAPPKSKQDENWAATTKPNDSYQAPTEGNASVPAPLPGRAPTAPGVDGYSIDEIQEVTRGFFGTISTGLAGVIEHAFKTSGRPTAYVLGTEGGGAFLAGLRFGEGTLYMRNYPETRKVWWHGPSIGGDFGASGTRTLFLIYKLPEQNALYRTFTGVDGSAFFVGGVGMTVLKGGDVIMAPIRTGIGLRVGASIGYVRFTANPTWNPF
jgi:hypothetical protein